jgi:hypothetical protein
MSRLSKINNLRAFRVWEKFEAKERRNIHKRRHPKPVAKSDDNITPKRRAARV